MHYVVFENVVGTSIDSEALTVTGIHGSLGWNGAICVVGCIVTGEQVSCGRRNLDSVFSIVDEIVVRDGVF